MGALALMTVTTAVVEIGALSAWGLLPGVTAGVLWAGFSVMVAAWVET